MEEVLIGFENLKISAFTKYIHLNGDVHNVTIGPGSKLKKNELMEDKKNNGKMEEPQLKISETERTNKCSVYQVIKELERQRRETVQKEINDRYKKFEEFSTRQQLQSQNEWLIRQQILLENVKKEEAVVLEAIEQYDKNKSNGSEKFLKNYQVLIQQKMQLEQQMEKAREKHRILNENIEKVKKYQIEFRTVYEEILSIVKACPFSEDLKSALGNQLKLLNELPENLEEILEKCKTFTIKESDCKNAKDVVAQIIDLKVKIEECINQINKKKTEDGAKSDVKNSNCNLITSSHNDSLIPSELNKCISVTNFEKYNEIRQFSSEYTKLFQDLLNDDQMKQFRFDCKKAINIPVNAISAVSAEHLRDKYVKLFNLLSGKTVIIADRQINASKHPQGIPFCMDLLAKKFILQGDLMFSSNPEATFCYATIIVSLWNDFPDFGKLLLAYFYAQCPYLIPFYKPKTENESMEEYYKALGYQYVNGQIEKQDKFLKRMTGIMRLYFAVQIAQPKREQTKNLHNLKNAWNFLVSILKLEPQLDITATTLYVFLETVGSTMEKTYGIQFKKLVWIIVEKFIPLLKNIDSGGPVSRLEVLLQDYKSKGYFQQPNGILPKNFW